MEGTANVTLEISGKKKRTERLASTLRKKTTERANRVVCVQGQGRGESQEGVGISCRGWE